MFGDVRDPWTDDGQLSVELLRALAEQAASAAALASGGMPLISGPCGSVVGQDIPVVSGSTTITSPATTTLSPGTTWTIDGPPASAVRLDAPLSLGDAIWLDPGSAIALNIGVVGDLDLVGLPSALLLSPDTGGSTLSGLVHQSDPSGSATGGRVQTIVNVGPGLLTLPHQHSGAPPSSQLTLPGGTSLELPVGSSATLWDSPSTGWVLLSSSELPTGSVGTAELADGSVTDPKLADMPEARVKGRASGTGTGSPADLSGAQVAALLTIFSDAERGVAPPSGGGTANYLRADGAWAVPPGSGAVSGSGTAGRIAGWNTSTALESAPIEFTGGTVTFPTAAFFSLGVYGSASASQPLLLYSNSTGTPGGIHIQAGDWVETNVVLVAPAAPGNGGVLYALDADDLYYFRSADGNTYNLCTPDILDIVGAGSMASQDASAVAITGGSITGITDLAIADGGTGASTAPGARTNLGLGSSAVIDTGTSGTKVPLLDGSHTWSGQNTFAGAGIRIQDLSADHVLILTLGSELSTTRALTIFMVDANVALTLAGDATISGTNTGDQTTVSGNAGTVTVADAASDTTTWPLLAVNQTGSESPRTDAGLTYNASTNALTTTTFVGALTGNASTATALATPRTIGNVNFDGTANIVPETIASVNEATDTTCFLLFITNSGTQSLQPRNNVNLTFNSNTGALGATTLELNGGDTTLARVGAGDLTIESNIIYRAGGTDVPAADGGTGRSSHTAYTVLCGGTTTTAAQQSVASVGTAGDPLLSAGASALPAFGPVAGQVLGSSSVATSETKTAAAGVGDLATAQHLTFTLAAVSDVLIFCAAICTSDTTNAIDGLFADVDGSDTQVAATIVPVATGSATIAGILKVASLSAASHTIKLQFNTNAGTATFFSRGIVVVKA